MEPLQTYINYMGVNSPLHFISFQFRNSNSLNLLNIHCLSRNQICEQLSSRLKYFQTFFLLKYQKHSIRLSSFQSIPKLFIQQKRTNKKKENWTKLEHFLILKIFVYFVATRPEKKMNEDCGGTFITSGGFVSPLSLTHLLYPYDIVTLPMTLGPESSPYLFSPITEQKLAWNFVSLQTASQLIHNLSATDFRTPSCSGSKTQKTILENMHETTTENEYRRTETTPENSETPKVTLAPRKRRSIGPYEKFFDRISERKFKLSV